MRLSPRFVCGRSTGREASRSRGNLHSEVSNSAVLLVGRVPSGSLVERRSRRAPKRFRQELLRFIRGRVGANVRRPLLTLVPRGVIAELALHVDAIDGIV